MIIFNPDGNPESTSVDGTVGRDVTNEDWSTIIAGAGTTATDNSATMQVVEIIGDTSGNDFDSNDRGILLFDTSAIDNGAVIAKAFISVSVTGYNFENDDDSIFVVSANPASTTALVAADYGTLGSTPLSNEVVMSTWGPDDGFSVYKIFELNATGIATIDKAGISKFGFKSNYDINGTTPPNLTGASYIGATCISADSGNPANMPRLTVFFDSDDPGTLTGTCEELDLVLAIDRSGSIDAGEMAAYKAALTAWVDTLPINSTQVHVGVVSFSTAATIDQELTDDPQLVKDAIDALSAAGLTNIAEAIDDSVTEFAANARGGGITQLLLLVTDGVPTAGGDAETAADTARAAGINVFTLGVGNGVDQDLLALHIADYPNRAFLSTTFDDLQATLRDFLLCAEETTILARPIFFR